MMTRTVCLALPCLIALACAGSAEDDELLATGAAQSPNILLDPSMFCKFGMVAVVEWYANSWADGERPVPNRRSSEGKRGLCELVDELKAVQDFKHEPCDEGALFGIGIPNVALAPEKQWQDRRSPAYIEIALVTGVVTRRIRYELKRLSNATFYVEQVRMTGSGGDQEPEQSCQPERASR